MDKELIPDLKEKRLPNQEHVVKLFEKQIKKENPSGYYKIMTKLADGNYKGIRKSD